MPPDAGPMRARRAPAKGLRGLGRTITLSITLAMPLVLAGIAAHAQEQAPGQAPGQRYHVSPADLPAPYATDAVSNGPELIPRPPGTTLAVPDGFTATIFADGLNFPREFEVLPNGDVLVSEPRAGNITLLRDDDGDGAAETRSRFAGGFSRPYGLDRVGDTIYVADTSGVWALPHQSGATRAAGPAERVTPEGVLGRSNGHWTRSLVFHPDGDRYYVGVGSAGNIAEEPEPRATIREFSLSGGAADPGRTHATGLRNPVGIAFYPGTTDLYTVVNERDGMGDGLVPDYLTLVRAGAFYGWPYAYTGPNPQPGFADRRPDLVTASILPDLLFESHSAPIGLVFYDGGMFPQDYTGDAFVSLRGSWNRSDPIGYMVVRVPFADGRPAGGYEAFATGFWASGEKRAQVWGRPAGLTLAADGALLVADDAGGVIWRIAYRP